MGQKLVASLWEISEDVAEHFTGSYRVLLTNDRGTAESGQPEQCKGSLPALVIHDGYRNEKDVTHGPLSVDEIFDKLDQRRARKRSCLQTRNFRTWV